MSETLVDAAWLSAHPLPALGEGKDKDARGAALLVGGSAFVPGALALTGEAMLRAGAGKVKLATVDRAAIALGVSFPEAAIIALAADEEGEIAADAVTSLERHIGHCDALVLGPGMIERPHTPALIEALVERSDAASSVLLDAGALTAMRGKQGVLRHRDKSVVMTPHHGELAALTGLDKDRIADDPARAAADTAAAFGAVIALKSAETLIADSSGHLLRYVSEAPGLGTAGSGDVLAGVIGALLARGADPLVATAWGVWLHGEAGRAASRSIGTVGFLARDLLPGIPRLLAAGDAHEIARPTG